MKCISTVKSLNDEIAWGRPIFQHLLGLSLAGELGLREVSASILICLKQNN